MHERKTVPCRRLPKKMKAISATARQLRALPSNIFPAGWMQLVPDVTRDWCPPVFTGIVDPHGKERSNLRSILRFEPGVKDARANDPNEETEQKKTEDRPRFDSHLSEKAPRLSGNFHSRRERPPLHAGREKFPGYPNSNDQRRDRGIADKIMDAVE